METLSSDKKLNLRMMAMARVGGASLEEISELMGIEAGSVSKALNSVAGRMMIKDLQDHQVRLIHDRVVEKFVNVAEEMGDNLIDLARNAETDAIRFRATVDVLDRGGYRKEIDQTPQVPRVTINMSSNTYVTREGHMPITLITDVPYKEVLDGSESDGDERES